MMLPAEKARPSNQGVRVHNSFPAAREFIRNLRMLSVDGPRQLRLLRSKTVTLLYSSCAWQLKRPSRPRRRRRGDSTAVLSFLATPSFGTLLPLSTYMLLHIQHTIEAASRRPLPTTRPTSGSSSNRRRQALSARKERGTERARGGPKPKVGIYCAPATVPMRRVAATVAFPFETTHLLKPKLKCQSEIGLPPPQTR